MTVKLATEIRILKLESIEATIAGSPVFGPEDFRGIISDELIEKFKEPLPPYPKDTGTVIGEFSVPPDWMDDDDQTRT